MNGEHVTLGGEADAETELDVAKRATKKKRAKPEPDSFTPRPDTDTTTLSSANNTAWKFIVRLITRADLRRSRTFRGRKYFSGESENRRIDARKRARFCFFGKLRASLPALLALQKSGDFSRHAAVVYFDGRSGRKTSARAGACAKSKKSNGIRRGAKGECEIWSKGVPDWCVSRQRSWGVPIPFFIATAATKPIADPKIVNHVADIFQRKPPTPGITAKAKDLLPEGFQMPEMRQRGFSQRNRHSRRLVRFRFVVRRRFGNARQSAISGGRLSRRRRPVSRLV
jgi:hypothetical protein